NRHGVNAAIKRFAGIFALDGNGHRDFRIFDRGEADEPRDVFLAGNLGRPGLAGDANTGDAKGFNSCESSSGAMWWERGAFHTIEKRDALGAGEANGFGVLCDAARLVDESGLGENLAAGDGGCETRHLEGCHEHVTLADGHVGGVAGLPLVAAGAKLPLRLGDEHARGFAREFDAGALIEVKTARFGGDGLGRSAPADGVEIDITTLRDGVTEEHLTVVADAVVADERAVIH